ncbi:DUF721 domain-containing protein [[Kitasatospora] papulosa]|uniref:DUF721 domain-containing protein n=1 Tax=[Kitasatospora] papulosa TaxID=1464011 RepID=UPI002255A05E|nr:DUF721 domain-containing protein [[Kitasatospora] papulosa]MCX4417857.1 DUF721 domain-containing protein [[Kitasatospora] papulosa]
MGLGAAIGALVTERAWELPAAGATLRERWAAIAPELAGHVAAVSYDRDSGQLTVCPESSAWATKARLEQTRVIAARYEAAGRTVVRALRILPPGAAPAPGRCPARPRSGRAHQSRRRPVRSTSARPRCPRISTARDHKRPCHVERCGVRAMTGQPLRAADAGLMKGKRHQTGSCGVNHSSCWGNECRIGSLPQQVGEQTYPSNKGGPRCLRLQRRVRHPRIPLSGLLQHRPRQLERCSFPRRKVAARPRTWRSTS